MSKKISYWWKRLLPVVAIFAIVLILLPFLPFGNSSEPNGSTPAPSDTTAHTQYVITEDILQASTDILLDHILADPALVELLMASTPDMDCYATMRENYPAFIELESRSDAVTVMIRKLYETAQAQPNGGTLETLYLNSMLSSPFYWRRLSKEQIASYARILDSCGLSAGITETEPPEGNYIVPFE